MLVVLMSFINRHVLSEEHFIGDIISNYWIIFTSSRYFLIIFLDLWALSVKTLGQCNAHSNRADKLNKHYYTNLPIYTKVNCDCSSYKMEVESDLVNVFPQINSVID